MAEMTGRTATEMLREWGLWARDDSGGRIGYPGQSPVAPASPSRGRSAAITDDDAMEIDGIVARLASRDQQMGRAIAVYYSPNGSFSKVASALGVGWNRASILVHSGTAWVSCAMDMRSAA